MKTKVRVSFADMMERMDGLVAQSKRFSKFEMPPNINEQIRLCSVARRAGNDGEAVRLGLLVEQGLTKLLLAYFRNSERYFDRIIQQKDPGYYDQDVWGKLMSAYHKDFLPEVRTQAELDVKHCANVYCYMNNMLVWVDGEQRRRGHNRQVKHEQERAKRLAEQAAAAESRKAQQRREAFEKRYQDADRLLKLIA
jgi:hypothetical protein